MALNIKNEEVERMAAELATLTEETKTGGIRQALSERLARLRLERGGTGERAGGISRFLAAEVWPLVPVEELDRLPLTRAEREDILGIGPEGR
ncbi:MAG TPA: type II toxin-antitoxin system VapB family antitoxin [Solirubrobacterales bacterium]|nr:type II toxin-antitoxin system VapB family antitoxin [Solirubrobacterales bacterium]